MSHNGVAKSLKTENMSCEKCTCATRLFIFGLETISGGLVLDWQGGPRVKMRPFAPWRPPPSLKKEMQKSSCKILKLNLFSMPLHALLYDLTFTIAKEDFVIVLS